MEIKFNVTKEERKTLIKAVGEITGWAPVYKGAPSFAFAVGGYIINRHGILICNERTDTEDVRCLLAGLSERGFTYERATVSLTSDLPEHIGDSPEDTSSDKISDAETSDRLVIEVPIEGFSATALYNLERLISGKAVLIMKAIGTNTLPIERTEEKLCFPWFPVTASSEEADAYARFIHALCKMAKTQKRVTMKESAVDSEKFAFRCFLLRLGFIGAEFASARRILLSNLSGNGSFKSGKRKDSGSATAVDGGNSSNCPAYAGHIGKATI